jgi:peptide/nickel transport system substrate-binding protein
MAAVLCALPGAAGDEPKYGGTLTYMIPADAPPSFDGHRDTYYATVHSVAEARDLLAAITAGSLRDSPRPIS